ncbi:MAG: hypothetical protein JJV99_09495 [Colwellia sp.]|nr:hypothetical protein [Colwellia sp.]
MKEQWQAYGKKYLALTAREQYLILITGFVILFFPIFHLLIDPIIVANKKSTSNIERLISSNKSLKTSVAELELTLQSDPNELIRKKITQYQTKLAKIDAKLLALTSDLINPVQMRHALLDLLKLKKGVSLLSFELLDVKPLLVLKGEEKGLNNKEQGLKYENKSLSLKPQSNTDQNLYQHGIKIKLLGSYFDLQTYLQQLEQMPWKFFWQDFNFKVKEYPKSELDIIIYSLSTKKEFVGV